MPDKVFFNEDIGVIEVESYGVVTKNDIQESIRTILQIAQDKGINWLLVDTTRQETMPSTTGIYDIFSTFPRSLKLALLVQPSQTTAEDIRFVETVGVNRGFSMQIFHSREEALKWLKS